MAVTKYSQESGIYLVAESIDCGGKGSIINAIKESEISKGKLVVDLRLLWPSGDDGMQLGHENPLISIYQDNNIIPEYERIKEYYLKLAGRKIDVLITCEPTWANTGLKIRKKIVHEIKGVNHTAKDTAEAYAEDRHELISKLIKPAILDGVDVFCERNFCSSVVYQSSMDTPLTVKDILRIEGNAYAAENSPHLYVICDLSADTAMERKDLRKKADECRFEVPEFQRRIEGKYRSEWLKDLLKSYGSVVVYVNTEKPTTHKDTTQAALKVVTLFKERELSHGQKFNYTIK